MNSNILIDSVFEKLDISKELTDFLKTKIKKSEGKKSNPRARKIFSPSDFRSITSKYFVISDNIRFVHKDLYTFDVNDKEFTRCSFLEKFYSFVAGGFFTPSVSTLKQTVIKNTNEIQSFIVDFYNIERVVYDYEPACTEGLEYIHHLTTTMHFIYTQKGYVVLKNNRLVKFSEIIKHFV